MRQEVTVELTRWDFNVIMGAIAGQQTLMLDCFDKMIADNRHGDRFKDKYKVLEYFTDTLNKVQNPTEVIIKIHPGI